MKGFYKWLSSTKFQISVLSIGLIYLQQGLYGLDPDSVTDAIVKICIAYMGARIIEPIVEAAVVIKQNGKKEKV